MKKTEKPIDKKSPPKLSRNTLILRRNLMLAATITLITLLFKIEVTSPSILGLELSGLTKLEICIIMLMLISYFLVHFFISVITEWKEWKAKLVLEPLADDSMTGWMTNYTELSILDFFEHSIVAPIAEHVKDGKIKEAGKVKIDHVISELEVYVRGIHNLTKWGQVQFFGFEIGLPVAMGLIAIGWLGRLICAY